MKSCTILLCFILLSSLVTEKVLSQEEPEPGVTETADPASNDDTEDTGLDTVTGGPDQEGDSDGAGLAVAVTEPVQTEAEKPADQLVTEAANNAQTTEAPEKKVDSAPTEANKKVSEVPSIEHTDPPVVAATEAPSAGQTEAPAAAKTTEAVKEPQTTAEAAGGILIATTEAAKEPEAAETTVDVVQTAAPSVTTQGKDSPVLNGTTSVPEIRTVSTEAAAVISTEAAEVSKAVSAAEVAGTTETVTTAPSTTEAIPEGITSVVSVVQDVSTEESTTAAAVAEGTTESSDNITRATTVPPDMKKVRKPGIVGKFPNGQENVTHQATHSVSVNQMPGLAGLTTSQSPLSKDFMLESSTQSTLITGENVLTPESLEEKGTGTRMTTVQDEEKYLVDVTTDKSVESVTRAFALGGTGGSTQNFARIMNTSSVIDQTQEYSKEQVTAQTDEVTLDREKPVHHKSGQLQMTTTGGYWSVTDSFQDVTVSPNFHKNISSQVSGNQSSASTVDMTGQTLGNNHDNVTSLPNETVVTQDSEESTTVMTETQKTTVNLSPRLPSKVQTTTGLSIPSSTEQITPASVSEHGTTILELPQEATESTTIATNLTISTMTADAVKDSFQDVTVSPNFHKNISSQVAGNQSSASTVDMTGQTSRKNGTSLPNETMVTQDSEEFTTVMTETQKTTEKLLPRLPSKVQTTTGLSIPSSTEQTTQAFVTEHGTTILEIPQEATESATIATNLTISGVTADAEEKEQQQGTEQDNVNLSEPPTQASTMYQTTQTVSAMTTLYAEKNISAGVIEAKKGNRTVLSTLVPVLETTTKTSTSTGASSSEIFITEGHIVRRPTKGYMLSATPHSVIDKIVATETSKPPAMTTISDEKSEVTSIKSTSVNVPPAEDPCQPSSHTVLSDHWRHFESVVPEGSNASYSDNKLPPGWYKFWYAGQDSVIPTKCLKIGQCSSDLPIHVDLRGQDMPEVGQVIAASVRSIIVVKGKPSCSLFQRDIQIKGCPGNFFVYKLPPAAVEGSVYCLQWPSETVPLELQGDYIPPVTTLPATTVTTTASTTTKTEAPVKSLAYQELKESRKDEVDNAVTVVFQTGGSMTEEKLLIFNKMFREILIEFLNKQRRQSSIATTPVPSIDHDAEGATPKPQEPETTKPSEDKNLVPGSDVVEAVKSSGSQEVVHDVDPDASGPVPNPRGKRDTAKHLQPDDMVYIGSLPTVKGDGKLEVSIFVNNKTAKNGLVLQNDLLDALEQLNATGRLPQGVNMSVVAIFPGLPSDMYEPGAVVKKDVDLWHEHMGLFICMIVLAGLCLIIIIIGLMCIRCRRSGGWYCDDKSPIRLEEGTPEKQPLPMDSPISDEEITRGEAPMVECENPGYTPNGGGEHMNKKDEDNGWVVPISELTAGERDQPEVEDTKL